MNKTYEFYFTDDGRFACTKTTESKTVHFYEDKALDLLKKKDRLHFKKAKVSDKKIRLSNNNTTIVIYDLEEFYDNDLCSYIPNSLPRIKRAIVKYQKSKNKNQEIKRNKTRGLLVASSLVLMILGASSELIKSNVDEEKYSEALEKEIDDLEVIEQNIILDNVKVKVEVDTNQLLEELEEENSTITYLDYDTEIDEIKADHAYENYYDIVEKYANKWGVSPNLAQSMLTQESGGYHTNLMQIQFNSWIDMPLKVYNFNDNKYNTIVLTDNPQNYNGKGYICITRKDLENPITNISVGCIIIRKSCQSMNNHIGAGIQCYNFGVGNMNKVLVATSEAEGIEIDDLLADQANLDFTNYTNIISVGDPNYLQNVVRYAEAPEEGFSLKYLDEDGNIQELNVSILPENMKTL